MKHSGSVTHVGLNELSLSARALTTLSQLLLAESFSMKAANKWKNASLLCQFVHAFSQLVGELERSQERYRGKLHGPNERADCSVPEKKGFRERPFQVAVLAYAAEKRLLFQRNFYIYPSAERKPRICFYSRILLVTSHSGSLFLFLTVLSSLVLHGPHSQANTRDFQQAWLANSSQSSRASVHKQK